MKRREPHRLGLPGGGELGSDAAAAGAAPSTVSPLDRWLVRAITTLGGEPPIAIELWNGEIAYRHPGTIAGTLVVNERRALAEMLLARELGFGDAYSTGRVRVEGDLLAFLEGVSRAAFSVAPPGSWRHRLAAALVRPRENSPHAARENISHHYDLGNDFYRLWLDERLVYTCAYYPSTGATLEDAQVAKMDHVARKLRLAPDETVVEAGCGWGSLALHLAARYGARVRAFNISREQIEFARERARAEGLGGRVEFVEDDYRNITGRYDAFVSVGMLEHVGVEHYGAFGALVRRTLNANGRGLVHTIGRNRPAPNSPWIEKRIFPGSRPPALSEIMRVIEPHGFSVLDVENLRLHYARTCREWLARFDAVADTVEKMYDPTFARAWRLYLAGSVTAFTIGSLQLFQVVFAPSASNRLALTREHLYRDVTAESWE